VLELDCEECAAHESVKYGVITSRLSRAKRLLGAYAHSLKGVDERRRID
jgi:hypothetical protein